jgi:hypothetical protein
MSLGGNTESTVSALVVRWDSLSAADFGSCFKQSLAKLKQFSFVAVSAVGDLGASALIKAPCFPSWSEVLCCIVGAGQVMVLKSKLG